MTWKPAGGLEGGLGDTGSRRPPVRHSWIIGAAVVNAFYSPNRNQIGTFMPSDRPQPLLLGGTSARAPKERTSPHL